ncbi:unnamed protein product [Angiostrongylus costaricensis]|uniref:Unspecific monooxygenase n=1 Tax=Angiostrongylus costaricensis TaxID=334426 RepID=A0A158PGR6_ANGCS|nr:unnamed protein product [Angiostrongylus costaricensis]
MICDFKAIKDTFIKNGEAYAGAFQFQAMKEYRGGEYGVVETTGQLWHEHRRFALHVLKSLGLSKNTMERRILAEVEAMSETLHAMEGEEIEMQDVFDVGVGSVINQLLFGYRFDADNLGEFRELRAMKSRQMEGFSHTSVAILFMYPWMKSLPYFNRMWNRSAALLKSVLKQSGKLFQPITSRFTGKVSCILAMLLDSFDDGHTAVLHPSCYIPHQKSYEKQVVLCRDAVFSFFDRQIDVHRKHIDYDAEESNDYVEAFLKEKRRRETNGYTESFSNVQLQNMCYDLWSAGMETTSNTLSWGVVYLLSNLDVQLSVILLEIQRMANLLPTNLPHETLCPVQVGKWSLPAHTGVIAQISNVLYDNEVFPSPLTFDPTRFIDEDGRSKKVEELIPFSIGKRQCLGEGLARTELFLFIANLFNRFEVQEVLFLLLLSSNKADITF